MTTTKTMGTFYRENPAPWRSWTAEQQQDCLRLQQLTLRLVGPTPRMARNPYLKDRSRAVAAALAKQKEEWQVLKRRAQRDPKARAERNSHYFGPRHVARDLLGRPVTTPEASRRAFRVATGGFEPMPEWTAEDDARLAKAKARLATR